MSKVGKFCLEFVGKSSEKNGNVIKKLFLPTVHSVFPLIMGFLGNKGRLFTSDAKLMFKARCFGIISESDDEDQKLISFSQLHENRSKA